MAHPPAGMGAALLDAPPPPAPSAHRLRKPFCSWPSAAQAVASIGNFGIQYNFGALGIATAIMTASQGTIIPSDGSAASDLAPDYPEPKWASYTILGLVFAGAMVGMVSMGRIGDLIGRRYGMVLTLSLIVAGALASALLTWGGQGSLWAILAVSRFVLGLGVGGLYPMSAATAHEQVEEDDEDAETLVGWAAWWQSPGAMSPYVVALFLVQAPSGPDVSSWQFRVLMGLGAVVAAVPLVVSFWGPATPSASASDHTTSGGHGGVVGREGSELELEPSSAKRPARGATAAVHSGSGGIGYTSLATIDAEDGRGGSAVGVGAAVVSATRDPRHWWTLIGTGGTWLVYDISYFGTAIFQPLILKSIFGSSESLTSLCWQSVVVSAFGLPAAAGGILLLKPKGGRWLNIWGFTLIGACFVALAICYAVSPTGLSALKFVIFCALTFALNTGPSTATFVLAASAYPTEVRGTFHGLSAACGKLGAVIGTFIYQPLSDAYGIASVLWLQTAFCIIGVLMSVFFLPRTPTVTELAAARQRKGIQ